MSKLEGLKTQFTIRSNRTTQKPQVVENDTQESSLKQQFDRLQPQKNYIRYGRDFRSDNANSLNDDTYKRFNRSTSYTSLGFNEVSHDSKGKLGAISCFELFETLSRNPIGILFFDIRPLEDFIGGHISWKSLGNGSMGGVINLEPSFIKSDITCSDIEVLCKMGTTTLDQLNLFNGRHKIDQIVLYDADSRKSSALSAFELVYNAIYESKNIQPPKAKAMILSGGFQAWKYFLKTSDLDISEWIQSGENTGFRADEKVNQHISSNQKSIVLNNNNWSKSASSTDMNLRNNENPTRPGNHNFQTKFNDYPSNSISKSRYTFEDPFFAFERKKDTTVPSSNNLTQTGLAEPLIALPPKDEYAEALSKFPEIELNSLTKVNYPSLHSRSNSPNPYQQTPYSVVPNSYNNTSYRPVLQNLYQPNSLGQSEAFYSQQSRDLRYGGVSSVTNHQQSSNLTNSSLIPPKSPKRYDTRPVVQTQESFRNISERFNSGNSTPPQVPPKSSIYTGSAPAIPIKPSKMEPPPIAPRPA
jgi:hypothetical protein